MQVAAMQRCGTEACASSSSCSMTGTARTPIRVSARPGGCVSACSRPPRCLSSPGCSPAGPAHPTQHLQQASTPCPTGQVRCACVRQGTRRRRRRRRRHEGRHHRARPPALLLRRSIPPHVPALHCRRERAPLQTCASAGAKASNSSSTTTSKAEVGGRRRRQLRGFLKCARSLAGCRPRAAATTVHTLAR